MDLTNIQSSLQHKNIDGWLFMDFHNRDRLGYRVLGMDPDKFTSRRWFYWIPKTGEAQKIVHKVEPSKLEQLPGKTHYYHAYTDLQTLLKDVLKDAQTVAMQYSPYCNIPAVSLVDAGTVEMVRAADCQVVSSAELVQEFESLLDEEQYGTHVEAGKRVQAIKDQAFDKAQQAVKAGIALTEYELQQFIVQRFEEEGLTCDGEYPIVGVNEHPANPHFEPTPENSYVIKAGDTLLIDLWARLNQDRAVYYDITWCAFVGEKIPAKYEEIFTIAAQARDTGVALVRARISSGQAVFGWEVDQAVRQVIEDAGYGEYFVHRTGHSIGEAVHGNGANIDNLETKDERPLVPGLCFSIEPGIYLPEEMAVRTEIDVFITPAGEVSVTGAIQKALITMDVS